MSLLELYLLLPLIILGGGALVLLMAGVFSGSARLTGLLTGAVIAGAAVPLLWQPLTGAAFALSESQHLLQFSPFTNLATLLLLALALLVLPVLAQLPGKMHQPEPYVLLILSLTGMVALVASAHLITFYVALELLSFPLYILAAYARDDAKSSEAGLKYFVLGSLASGLMLFGMSLLYAQTGNLSFAGIYEVFRASPGAANGLVLAGSTLMLVGVLFKLSVVPLHLWTPDVYEGAPTPITALMAALPKLAALALLVRLLAGPLVSLESLWQPGLAWLAALTMAVGAVLAVVQTNLKRLLAFSTIANVGFMLAGVVAATAAGTSGMLFYATIYALATLGLFAVILATGATKIEHLKGLAQRQPALAACLLILLFGLAGIPPLAGFMGKFMVFAAAVQAGFSWLAVAGVLASVVACFYSLNLIKVAYFEAPTSKAAITVAPGLQVVLVLTVGFTLLLGVFPNLIANLTLAAATAIF